MTFWTPTEITTSLWIDSSDSSTVTVSIADIISIDDKSGNGNDATGSNDSNDLPKLKSAFWNSLDVIELSTSLYGTVKYLYGDIDETFTAQSVFIVFSHTASDDWRRIFVTGDWGAPLEPAYAQILEQYSTNNVGSLVIDSAGTETPVVFSVSDSTSPSLISSIHSGSLVSCNLDGGAQSSFAHTLNLYSADYHIGDWINTFQGHVGEVIMLNYEADTETRQKIEGYLAHKWGTDGNLPSGHPFKSNAPEISSGPQGNISVFPVVSGIADTTPLVGWGDIEAPTTNGRVFGIATNPILADGNIVAPLIDITGATQNLSYGEIVQPVSVLSGTANTLTYGWGDVKAKSIKVNGVAATSIIAMGDIKPKQIKMSAVAGDYCGMVAPMAGLSGVANTMNYGNANIEIKHSILNAFGDVSLRGSGHIKVKLPVVSGMAQQSAFGWGDVAQPFSRLSGAAVVANHGIGNIDVMPVIHGRTKLPETYEIIQYSRGCQ